MAMGMMTPFKYNTKAQSIKEKLKAGLKTLKLLCERQCQKN